MKTVPISAIRSEHLEAAKQFLEIPEEEKPLSTWGFYETIAEVWEDHSVENLPPIIIKPTPAPFRVCGPAEIEVWHPVLFPAKRKILLWEYFVTLDLADAHRVPVIVGTLDTPQVAYKPPGMEMDKEAYDGALAAIQAAVASANGSPTTTKAAYLKQKQQEQQAALAASLKKTLYYGNDGATLTTGTTSGPAFIYGYNQLAGQPMAPKPAKLKKFPLASQPYGWDLPPDNFDLE